MRFTMWVVFEEVGQYPMILSQNCIQVEMMLVDPIKDEFNEFFFSMKG